MTPTSGGSTAGSAINEPRSLRPGNSNHSKRKASGMPITAARATLATEIQQLAQSALHSVLRDTKAWIAVACPASTATMSTG